MIAAVAVRERWYICDGSVLTVSPHQLSLFPTYNGDIVLHFTSSNGFLLWRLFKPLRTAHAIFNRRPLTKISSAARTFRTSSSVAYVKLWSFSDQ